MKKNNLAKNTLLLSIGTILNKGILILMIPLFSAWLSTEDYGRFDLLSTYITMLIPILSLSVGDGIFRLGIDEKTQKKKSYITTGLIIYTIGILIFGIVAIFIGIGFHYELILPFYVMLAGEFFNKYLQSYLRTIKKLNIYSFFTVISTIVTFISVTILVKMMNTGIYGIIYGYAIGYFVSNILIVLTTKLHTYLTKQWSIKEIKELIKYSLPLIPNSLSWWIVNASDTTIINFFINTTANGIYAMANKIPNICTSIFSVFSIAWQESAIDMKDSKERNNYYNEVYNKMVLILISLCIGILSCNFIIFDYILDVKYIEARLYTSILVTSVIFNIISQFYGGIQISLKQPKANGITTIIGAVSNILVHLILIKFVGLYAAALSTLISQIIIVVLRKKILYKDVKIKTDTKCYKYIALYVLVAICSYYYKELPIYINIISLIISIIVFVAINKENIIKIFNKMLKKKRC